ncbi:MAG: glycine cleavage system protein GcvH [Thiobacillus sp.]
MNPADCLYHKEHLWVRREGENEAWVGVTDYAQNSLGEIVYVECPDVNAEIKQGSSCGVIESVKVVSDLISPLSGRVLAINDAASADPSCINRDPYLEGWLFKMDIADIGELGGLISAVDYADYVNGT